MRIPAVPTLVSILVSIPAFGDSFSAVFGTNTGPVASVASVSLTVNRTGGIDFALKSLGNFTLSSLAWNSASNSVPVLSLASPGSTLNKITLTTKKDGITGYGSVGQKLDYELGLGSNGYSSSVKSLAFSVGKKDGTAFSSVTELLGTSGKDNALFALHVFDSSSRLNVAKNAVVVRTNVDEPSAIAILLTHLAGLAGLVYWQRRRIWA